MKKTNIISLLPKLRSRPARVAQKGKKGNNIIHVRFSPARRPTLPPAA